jgi:preprotein translocase subunit SecG
MLSFFIYLTLTLFIIVCIFLILLVLIQKGRGGGLASAFGGAGGSTAFGSKTGDVLTWATSIVFGIFLVLAVALNLLANAQYKQRAAGRMSTAPPAPVVPPTPEIPAASPEATPPATTPVPAAVPAGLNGSPAPLPSPTRGEGERGALPSSQKVEAVKTTTQPASR